MACLEAPAIPIPDLPTGITLAATLPTFNFNVKLCCKILQFSPQIPIPLSLPIPLTLFAVINATKDEVLQYIAELSVDCPRE